MMEELETVVEADLKNRQRKDFFLNIAIHVPIYFQAGSVVFDYLITGNDSLEYMNGPSFYGGLALIAVGGLAKIANDVSGMEEIIDKQGDALVTEGFYSISRHPCYLSQRVISTGLLALIPNWINAAAYVTFLGMTEILAQREEKTNQLKFGEAYKEYMDRVPRWGIPVKKLAERVYQSARNILPHSNIKI